MKNGKKIHIFAYGYTVVSVPFGYRLVDYVEIFYNLTDFLSTSINYWNGDIVISDLIKDLPIYLFNFVSFASYIFLWGWASWICGFIVFTKSKNFHPLFLQIFFSKHLLPLSLVYLLRTPFMHVLCTICVMYLFMHFF